LLGGGHSHDFAVVGMWIKVGWGYFVWLQTIGVKNLYQFNVLSPRVYVSIQKTHTTIIYLITGEPLALVLGSWLPSDPW